MGLAFRVFCFVLWVTCCGLRVWMHRILSSIGLAFRILLRVRVADYLQSLGYNFFAGYVL